MSTLKFISRLLAKIGVFILSFYIYFASSFASVAIGAYFFKNQTANAEKQLFKALNYTFNIRAMLASMILYSVFTLFNLFVLIMFYNRLPKYKDNLDLKNTYLYTLAICTFVYIMELIVIQFVPSLKRIAHLFIMVFPPQRVNDVSVFGWVIVGSIVFFSWFVPLWYYKLKWLFIERQHEME